MEKGFFVRISQRAAGAGLFLASLHAVPVRLITELKDSEREKALLSSCLQLYWNFVGTSLAVLRLGTATSVLTRATYNLFIFLQFQT